MRIGDVEALELWLICIQNIYLVTSWLRYTHPANSPELHTVTEDDYHLYGLALDHIEY